MKEQIQLLIEQHKLHKAEAEQECSNWDNIKSNEVLEKEIEMRIIFISELEELLSS